MISIRAITRSVPKVILRSSSAIRPLSTNFRPTFLRSTWKPTLRSTYPAFSTSISRREPAGESDQELAEKLGHELYLEKDNRVGPQELLQDYIENGPFKIQDTPGQEEVVLTRKYGNEDVKVTFSIADMNDVGDEDVDALDEDPAMDDEDVDIEQDLAASRSKRTINQAGSRASNVDVMAEDSIAPADRAAQGEQEDVTAGEDQAFPVRLIVTITKPGKGAVQVEALAQDGTVEVRDVYYFPDADVADPKTAEKVHARNNVYAGPPFQNLDQDLQSMIERYLDERGINSQLAVFVPDYIQYKEQTEYTNWLSSMKDFVDA